ncbi:acriflavin resistance protein [Alicyclobacillus hesperidum URH17-3-68]|uniref:Uncharacterized protein n=1 Tax=Alicyclobacillus hesperidum TaxID=89784 RepID=A0AA37X4R7_9BACL|nr:hypothetical protein [Alicyclobacillus hesperidum]EJY56516.1 acriflavin resistance protein [Alicyclobacillus hesperidum URH17-3-68]GLV13388.1 hypothetical protein Heshes_10720 [Alicyclobacillus hesperidum]
MNESDESPQLQGETTAERTLAAIEIIEERVRSNAHGFDRVIVNQALPLIHPRLEQRILSVPESELIAELRHVQALLQAILGEPATTKRKRRGKRVAEKTRRQSTPRR